MYFKTEEIALAPASQEEKTLLSRILKDEYGLPLVSSETKIFLEKTASSRVYKCRLKNGCFVVVKKSFWHKNDASFEKAYFVSEALRKHAVKLPKAFQNKKGYFVSVEGHDKFIVLEFIEGKHFSSQDAEFLSGGYALGCFHREGMNFLKENFDEWRNIQVAIPVEKPYEETRKLYRKFLRADMISAHSCGVLEVCKTVRENIDLIDETIKFIDYSGVSNADGRELSRGLVHNDFNINNALFNGDGSFATFLDVDQLGIAPFIWDVGNTLTSYASNFVGCVDEKDFPKHAAAFLRAYHREFPLPKKEYGLILAATQRWDVMRILRSLWRHHHDNNRLPGLLPKIRERLIPRIKDAPRVLAFITPEWIKETLCIF